MAQSRSPRGAVDEDEPAARRPVRRRERETVDREEPEAADAELADDGELELAEDAEFEPAEDGEPEPADDAEFEPAGDGEPEPAEDGELEDYEEPAEADGTAGPDRSGRRRRRHAERGRDSALTAKQAARAALRQIVELTGKQAESVTEVGRAEDGWVVGVEVVEDRRIPSAADILAIYQATIDTQGELVSYRRARRYMRGRGDPGDGS